VTGAADISGPDVLGDQLGKPDDAPLPFRPSIGSTPAKLGEPAVATHRLLGTRSAEGAATVLSGYRGIVCCATALPPIGLGATPRGIALPRKVHDHLACSRIAGGSSRHTRKRS